MRNKIAELEIRVAQLERRAGFWSNFKGALKNSLLLSKLGFKYGVSLQGFDRFDLSDSVYAIPVFEDTEADLKKIYGDKIYDPKYLWKFRGATAVVTVTSAELYDGQEIKGFGGRALKALLDTSLRLNGVRK
jgi:hypothetical protein